MREADEKLINELRDNPSRIVRRLVAYAISQAKREKVEPWIIVKEITGHGSTVSNAIVLAFGDENYLDLSEKVHP